MQGVRVMSAQDVTFNQSVEIVNACGGWLKFSALVRSHREHGMDNDLAARQIVDDLYRQGHNFQFQQHLVEAMAAMVK